MRCLMFVLAGAIMLLYAAIWHCALYSIIQKWKILTYHCLIWGWYVTSSFSTSTTSMLPASTSYSSTSSSRRMCITTIVFSTRTEGWVWGEWWSPCCRAWGTGVEERHTWKNWGDKCRPTWPVKEGYSWRCRAWLKSDQWWCCRWSSNRCTLNWCG